MTRNACLNHPEEKVIEVPKGYRYCTRCHHLVAPELEVVEIIKEEVVEAEPEQSVEEMKEEVEKIIEDSNIPEEVKKDIVVEIVKEEVKEPLEESPEETAPAEVVEAIVEEAVVPEPEVAVEDDRTAVEALKEDVSEVEAADKARKAEIARLRAQLAELE